MEHDAFVYFWIGTLAGMILGIALAAVLAAISNNIERKGNGNE